MSELLLDRATAYAYKRLEEAGGDVLQLPLALQTVVAIDTAQGIIDNGGLEYFLRE